MCTYFDPHSPCGERHGHGGLLVYWCVISIHALLAESDEILSPFNGLTAEISIHALLAESDRLGRRVVLVKAYFYPRSPCGERLGHRHPAADLYRFLSTLSLRRATVAGAGAAPQIGGFLSTLSLRRATCCPATAPRANSYFYPRSPCGERRASCRICYAVRKFLSTLSLRRATCPDNRKHPEYSHFYPRSPCGERLSSLGLAYTVSGISIHALLAESDCRLRSTLGALPGPFLSTLSLRRATKLQDYATTATVFLSTLSLRRATSLRASISGRASFLSTLSLRRATKERKVLIADVYIFRSTLSLRRATRSRGSPRILVRDFYPRSPCGERLAVFFLDLVALAISIHALLAESDCISAGVVL